MHELIHRTSLRTTHRSGFTLMEMLVVLLIIGVLAAISVSALLTIPDRARARGTEATITKIDSKLSQLVEDFSQRRKSMQPIAADIALSGVAPHPNRARLIAAVRNMRQEFPEFFYVDTTLNNDSKNNDGDNQTDELDEIIVGQWNPVLTQTGQQLPAAAIAHLKYMERAHAELTSKQLPLDTQHSPATARSECLYMIVTRGGTDVGEFNADEVGDTDADGLLEFVDKWGNPLQFFLWPTHYESAVQRPGAETNPDDPQQLLTETAGQTPWWSDANRGGVFAALYHSISKSNGALQAPPAPPLVQNLPAGYKTRFLVVSAGSDQGFGLVTADAGDDQIMGTLDDIGSADKRAIRITDPGTEGYGMDSDNIDNHNLRAR